MSSARSIVLLWVFATSVSAQTLTFAPSADTHVQRLAPNRVHGLERTIDVQADALGRGLLQFDPAAIRTALGAANLLSARLRLSITETTPKGAQFLHSVGVHRMRRSWSEAGATWNCPVDTTPANAVANCNPSWEMANYASWPFEQTPTRVATVRSGQTGWVEWDVTVDVAAVMAGTPFFGWLLLKENDAIAGSVVFSSREGAAPPQLVVTTGAPVPPTGVIPAAADTFLTTTTENAQEGYEPVLRVRDVPAHHALLRMDQSAIAQYVGTRQLTSARIRLHIESTSNTWGASGRPVTIHRMTRAWTERGATWNCPDDTLPLNLLKNCATDWNMDSPAQRPFLATPTATVIHRNGQTGWVEWDVTSDVAAFLTGAATNHGWLLRRPDGSVGGLVDYGSRETDFAPELVLTAASTLQITDFNPKSAPPGTAILLTGTNLAPASGSALSVTLSKSGGGTIEAPVSGVSATSLTFVIPPGAATGLVRVTVGANSVNSAVPLTVIAASTFTLSATPAGVDLLRGQSAALTVRLNSGNGFGQLAALSVGGLPGGVTAAFKPQQISAGQTSVLTLTAPLTQPLTTSAFTITAVATGGGSLLQASATASLTVRALSTTFTGRTVVDDALQTPLAGVTIRMLGKDGNGGNTACTGVGLSDAAGNFALQNLPASCVGSQLVGFDGLTATSPAGKYAGVNLVYMFTAGQVTASPVLVHLPRIDNRETFNVQQNSPVDQSYTFSSVPGLSVTVYRNTTFTMPDGSQPNPFPLVGVQVPIDRLPDAKPPVPTMLTAFIVAFQPANARASQPVAVYYPNTLAATPGSSLTLMTLDPTRGRMVPYGTGTIAPDGSHIIPDLDPAYPGKRYGIVNFDWHGGMFNPPPAVNTSAAAGGRAKGAGGTCGAPCGTDAAAMAGEPVDLASGLFVYNLTDLAISGSRGTVAIERIYRTLSDFAGPFGAGTAHAFDYQLDTNTPAIVGAISLINPDGSRALFSRQPNGTLVNTTVPYLRGAVMTTALDNSATIRQKDGSAMTFQPDSTPSSSQSSVTDPNGNVTTIVRNPANRRQITALVDPVGRQLVFTYDAESRVTSVTDPIGRAVTYTYHAPGTLATVTDPEGGITRYNYDAQNRLTQMIDPRGVTVFTNAFDVNGRVSQQTMPDGGVIRFAYVLANPLIPSSPVIATTVTDPLNRATTYRFNPEGFVVQVTDAMGQSRVFTRESGSNLLLSLTGNGACPVCGSPAAGDQYFTYDNNGNMLTQTDALGRTSRYTYDPVFQKPLTVTDPLGNVTRFAYDSRGNLLTTTDANNRATTLTYHASGLVKDVTDPLGQRTSFEYDAFGNLVSTTDAQGKTTLISWDAISRPNAVKDPLARSSRITYDRLSRVTSQTDPAGGVTGFAYDANGNLLSLTDARNNRTTFAYDNKNRVTTRTTQQGRFDTRTYDLNDNLTRFTDRRGQTSDFGYDLLGRLIAETYQDGAIVTRNYDANSRLIAVDDTAGGSFLYSYDAAGRLAVAVGPTGTVTYVRDSLGRVAQRTVIGQAPVTYAYDPVGNLLSASSPQASVANTYDARNQLQTVTRSNGVTSTYTRDSLGRLLSLVHARGATALNTQSYGYDAAGNRIRQANDIAQPLITQAAVSTVDSENRLLTRGNVTYSYDANGNRVTETSPAGTTTYSWDTRNRLMSISPPGAPTTTFRYDYMGMMLSQISAGATTAYVLDDLTNVVGILGSGSPIAVLTGRGVDQHLAVIQGPDTSFPVVNALNSTVAVTSSTETLAATHAYEPFGAWVADSDFPFKFTGRLATTNRDLYYRARHYDTVAGRFLSEDSDRYRRPGESAFAYVSNAPVMATDPSGHFVPLVFAPFAPFAWAAAGALMSQAAVSAYVSTTQFVASRPWVTAAALAVAQDAMERWAGVQDTTPYSNTTEFLYFLGTHAAQVTNSLYDANYAAAVEIQRALNAGIGVANSIWEQSPRLATAYGKSLCSIHQRRIMGVPYDYYWQ